MTSFKTKKILYVDMDNVLVDFPSGIAKISNELRTQYDERLDEVPGIFSLMEPLEGALEAYKELSMVCDKQSVTDEHPLH